MHDIPDSVARRALRTLVAYGEVVCLDGELHVRPGISLQPPPPMPMMPMLGMMPQMMPQMMMPQMGPMGSGPMGGMAAPAMAMAQGRPISHNGPWPHLALLMKHQADLQAARAAQMGQGGPPRR